MKVILTKEVSNLGKQGDVVTVAEGYARNYLLPRKMAIEASKGNMQNIERQHALEERLKEKRVATAQAAAGALEGKTITIRGKVGAGAKLFGSITASDIADAVKAQTGVELDRRKIDLHKPLRSIGEHEVPVRLHREVSGKLKVEIVSDEQE
ncbi:MAG: 50S ribosomal protein L9 [Armatimonadetes bacterium]|nr:50S ribosomal protein L9 [Armatimonadota bacterium]